MSVSLSLRNSESGALTALPSFDPSSTTGHALKQLVAPILKKKADELTLWLSNASIPLLLVDDLKFVAELGFGDLSQAVLLEGRDLGKPAPNKSELRRNIADKGTFSYYHAHAAETPLPDSLRYVYGGAPIPLNGTTTQSTTKEASVVVDSTSAAGKASLRTVTQYSWADAGANVKLYVTQPEALLIAKKDAKQNVKVSYRDQGLNIEVREAGKTVGWRLPLPTLYGKIDVGKSEAKGVRVSDSKISVTLVKLVGSSTKVKVEEETPETPETAAEEDSDDLEMPKTWWELKGTQNSGEHDFADDFDI